MEAVNPGCRQWIDAASYEDLCQKQMFGPDPSPFFDGGATEKYYEKMMERRRNKLSLDEQAAAASAVGWLGP